MPRYVAFLRAINVGGRVVPMAELRKHFEALGLTDVETFIASGNVIFSTRTTTLPALEQRIAKGLLKELGYEVPSFIRSGEEVAEIARYQPFTAAQVKVAKSNSVGLLAAPLLPEARKALMALQTKSDIFHLDKRELYWISRDGQNESVISNVLLERKLKVRVTFRGINTMIRLAAKYDF